ncbi:hypothetical protein D3C80_1718480 [compost metagenome]
MQRLGGHGFNGGAGQRHIFRRAANHHRQLTSGCTGRATADRGIEKTVAEGTEALGKLTADILFRG